MLLLIDPLFAVIQLVGAVVAEIIDWVRGPVPTVSEVGYRCLACGSDMSDEDLPFCATCGELEALNPITHEMGFRKIVKQRLGSRVKGFDGWKSAYQAEHKRRKRKHHHDKQVSLVGKHGLAISALRPAGEIELDGQKFSATAENSIIGPNSTVIVVGVKGNALCVRETDVVN